MDSVVILVEEVVRLQVRARLVLAVQEHVIIVAIKLVLMLVARIVNLHV